MTGGQEYGLSRVSRGSFDSVLACHAGAVQYVDYSTLHRGIITDPW